MRPFYFALLCCFLLLSNFSNAQDATKKNALTQKTFFASDAPLEMTLTSDFKKLKHLKKDVYQPATVTLQLPDATTVTEQIQVGPRGNLRREICATPPLMLNFKTTTPSKLSGLKKMKLVCGCATTSFDEQLIFKEFLTYKIFNQLTDMSFRVRLVKINYQDEANKGKVYTQYGFLIEDVDELAKRNECREFKKKVMGANSTDRNQMLLVAMFEYMIGNTDWSLPNNHNMKFIQLKSDTISFPYSVPYDFDYCGLVNAPYAVPQAEFAIEKVTDRYYRGFPCSPEEIEQMIELFKSKKQNIITLIQNFEPLKKSERQNMLDFLDGFYKTLDDKRQVKSLFIEGMSRY